MSPLPKTIQLPRLVRRGPAIVNGQDYPTAWDGFIGQAAVVEQIQTAIHSARVRRKRLDHMLLASGRYGIGKSTLARLTALEFDVGLAEVSGPLTVTDARRVLSEMTDRDVLFWDEFHLAVSRGRHKADWLLPLLADGVLVTAHGTEPVPDITVVAATTDAGKLPLTIISRFMIRPRLDLYTDEEAEQICLKLAERLKVRLQGNNVAARIARAANNNPRDMRMILVAVRDLATVGRVDLNKALEWAGLTYDGLTRECQDILLVLLSSRNFTAGLESIRATLGEPGPLGHHEQVLLQKGLIEITTRGRRLTDAGLRRAQKFAMNM